MRIVSPHTVLSILFVYLSLAVHSAKAQDFGDPDSDQPEQSSASLIADMLINVIENNCPCPDDPSVASQVNKFERCLNNQKVKGNKKVSPVAAYLDKENVADYRSELSDGLDLYKSDCETLPDPSDGEDDPEF